ncbi:MAG: signal peptidase I [Clostridia bacterium]|nr:signal peptidase I [Clostridia bacterium]
MSADRKKLYTVSILALALPILLFAFPEGSRVYAALLLPILALFASFLIKKRSVPSIYKNQVLLIISVGTAAAIMLYYLSGLYFGIGKTASYTPLELLTRALPLSAVILSVEYTRGLVLGASSKPATLIFSAGAILTYVTLSGEADSINSVYAFTELVGATLAPSISQNLLFNYLTRRHGFLPALTYKLTTTIYIYFIPYLPTAAPALVAAARITLPLLAYLFISSLYEKKRSYAIKRGTKLGPISLAALLICLIGLIMLTSCRFFVGAIVIGSGSMEGELHIGDVTVYTDSGGEEVAVGDILVFEKGGSRVVHRVYDLEYTNGSYRFYTKGDANEDADPGYVTEEEIIGTVKFKIPYVGWPTVWLSRLFDDRKGGSDV